MEHGLELIQSYPGNRWKFDFYNFLISWKYWKSDFPNFSYPGNTVKWVFYFSYMLEILEIYFFYILSYPANIANCFFNFPDILEILEIWFFLIFGIFTKKTRAEISRRMVRFSRRDLSYETDSGPKTKTVSDPNFQVTGWNTSSCSRPAAWRHA